MTRKRGGKIKAVLFDLDGTLIDSVPDLTWALNTMLRHFGLRMCNEDEVRGWIGDGAGKLVRRALTAQAQEDTICFDRALSLFMEAYGTVLSQKTTPYTGIDKVLTVCQQKGIRTALVTNKPERFIKPILRRFGWEDSFALVLGGDTLTTKKPDPAPLLYALKYLAVAPEDALMVGDSCNDILSAKRAGIKSIGVMWGYGASAFTDGCEASHYVKTPIELAERLHG